MQPPLGLVVVATTVAAVLTGTAAVGVPIKTALVAPLAIAGTAVP